LSAAAGVAGVAARGLFSSNRSAVEVRVRVRARLLLQHLPTLHFQAEAIDLLDLDKGWTVTALAPHQRAERFPAWAFGLRVNNSGHGDG
jgi:hypothetical protein